MSSPRRVRRSFDEEMSDQYEDEEITQEDAWTIIKSFFDQHGLVSQQISSYDRFMNYNLQEIMDEFSKIEITPQKQYAPGSKPCFVFSLIIFALHLFVIFYSCSTR